MVELIRSTDLFKTKRNALEQTSIGLVPTMGNLHSGHLSLLERSLKENNVSIVTIFVNPTQFGPNEDFDKYPRTLEADLDKIETLARDFADKKIIVFAPENPKEIYRKNFSTFIEVESMTNVLCGASRPGHFRGVTTVVYQLFAITRPTNAYFGEKDYQQLKVIERMTADLLLPIKINSVAIARENDGLALSSRNQYLSEAQREKALLLSKTLSSLKEELLKGALAEDLIEKLTTSTDEDLKWDYLQALDARNLEPIGKETSQILVAGALWVGSTRLIDNLRFNVNAR